MCGIAGWVGPGTGDALRTMIRSLTHRGPDETGLWLSSEAALGISRLAIVDVAHGQQPVQTPTGDIVAVFNGEIYNHRALREELSGLGVRFESESDAEIIPYLYQMRGMQFVQQLQGMFAIAIWDQRLKELVLIRDRVGKKPLHYIQEGTRLTFASEPKALFALGWRSPANLNSLDHVLALNHVPIETGAVHGLYSVPPGHVLRFRNGQVMTERYFAWMPTEYPDYVDNSVLRRSIEDAVSIRIPSERSVGSFLSGGIDSSIITALMARTSAKPIKTFSIGFADSRYDESQHARAVAKYLQTDHHELILDNNPTDLVLKLTEVFDQPFADPSALPTLALSQLASDSVTVALSGDGGDEVFAGYPRYRLAPIRHQLNPLLRLAHPFQPILRRTNQRIRSPQLARVVNALRGASPLALHYFQMMVYMPSHVRSLVWTPAALDLIHESHSPEERFLRVWAERDGMTPVNQMRSHDLAYYLPGDLLPKVDMASMAYSLEVRSPFLDRNVLELAGQLPKSTLIKGRETKWFLRQFAYELVPRHIVDRPKMGFGVPLAKWLRGPLHGLARDSLLDGTARQRGWFNHSVVASILDEHDTSLDRSHWIWPMLVIELWARRWIDAS